MRYTPQIVSSVSWRNQEYVLKPGMLYFPLFSRQHWIAGVRRYDSTSNRYTLTIHDSAPSIYLHQDIDRVFQEAWSNPILLEGWCIRQKRWSEDCGIFMTSIFLAIHTHTQIRIRDNMPSRLRSFLASLKKTTLPVGSFIRRMVYILLNKEHKEPLREGDVPTPQSHKKCERAKAKGTQARKATRCTPAQHKVKEHRTQKSRSRGQLSSYYDIHTFSVVGQERTPTMPHVVPTRPALKTSHDSGIPKQHALNNLFRKDPPTISAYTSLATWRR